TARMGTGAYVSQDTRLTLRHLLDKIATLFCRSYFSLVSELVHMASALRVARTVDPISCK
ncbi:MAG: hypothetical protein ACR2PO_05185, partial [Methyloligellaceae bacterium]